MPSPSGSDRSATVWIESALDWDWSGQSRTRGALAAAALGPPSWVPAVPLRREPVPVGPTAPARPSRTRARPRPGRRRRVIAAGGAGAAAAGVSIALLTAPRPASVPFIPVLGTTPTVAHAPAQPKAAIHRARTVTLPHRATTHTAAPAAHLPTLHLLDENASGSRIDAVSYHSAALDGRGSFLAYLPAHMSPDLHYPVLYLLHGQDQLGASFLRLGVARTLDRLIAHGKIHPLIAVMIDGRPGANEWSNGTDGKLASYVIEVQQLVDRMLPTDPVRSARAIAGFSMGGYGAMKIALQNPGRFAVVESWLGFFNGLGPLLRRDAPTIGQLGMHAFVYGGAQDAIANPAEDAPFGAALRAAGANARSAIYPGGHDFTTLEAHLAPMLKFAARGLSAPASAR
ncbi:MAG TPA: alpha/beta hydrolase-fold protein [Solirubrobacteraceae bacterium]|nr:alpha/beta hydrolase-fold protein [Solirubrobacteraceae bacterium]